MREDPPDSNHGCAGVLHGRCGGLKGPLLSPALLCMCRAVFTRATRLKLTHLTSPAYYLVAPECRTFQGVSALGLPYGFSGSVLRFPIWRSGFKPLYPSERE